MNKKTVLITGASRGIGKACALLFAENGYHVFLNCFKSVEQLKQVKDEIDKIPGASCDLVPGDVGNPEAVEQIAAKVRSRCSALDVLINNAGIANIGLMTDLSYEEWNRIIQTNLSSLFYCSKAFVPGMVSKKSGKILNISSMWGTAGASCEVAYSAAKSGVHGFTKALAKELAPSNIQVNAIACGVIDTDMNACLSEEDRLALSEEIPAGRFGTPKETAELVLSLALSPAYLTGQIIGFDGAFL